MRLFALFALLVSLPAAAQTEVAVGSDARGTLGASSPRAMLQNVGERPYQDYSVRLVPRQTVTIRLESDAFDPYLVILHGSSPHASNDDFNGSRTVSLIEYRSSGHGLYTIRVTAYGASAAGAFRLSVTDARPPPVASAPQPPAAERIELDGVQRSTLGPDSPLAPLTTDGEPRRYRDYTIQFNAGDPVVVAMSTEDFDPYLRVFRGSRQVAINDDYNGSRSNSRIEFTPSATGLYTIRATAFAADAVGSFVLATAPDPSASGGDRSGSGGGLDRLLASLDQAMNQPPVYRRVTRDGNTLVITSPSCTQRIPLSSTLRVISPNALGNTSIIADGVRGRCGQGEEAEYTKVNYDFETLAMHQRAKAAIEAYVVAWVESSGEAPPAASSRLPIPATGTGCLIGDCRSGYGAMRFANGEAYAGDFRDGLAHGRAVHTWPGGQRYEGDYRDGEKHGRGVLTTADGGRYEGVFAGGAPNGQGTHAAANGLTYVGTFRSGKRVGVHTATNRATGRVISIRYDDAGAFVEVVEVLVEGS